MTERIEIIRWRDALDKPLSALKVLNYLISSSDDYVQECDRSGLYWLLEMITDNIEQIIKSNAADEEILLNNN